jgi:hypothetical protein
MRSEVDLLYRQHLTDADRRALARVGAADASLSAQLEDPDLETLVFSGPAEGDLIGTSPFLTFAVAVHRTAARLATATHVEERWALRQRIPVFDVDPLREVVAEPARRLFLVELLASYTHVSSGATWQRTRRGWRRRRFSELDPVRLAELLEMVEGPERAGVYRRLGDLALFLTGVFPDHGPLFELGEIGTRRLLRLSGVDPRRHDDDVPGAELLRELGARWYEQAVRSVQAHGLPMTDGLAVMRDVGQRFDSARRVLNLATDWYIFPWRQQWFGMA